MKRKGNAEAGQKEKKWVQFLRPRMVKNLYTSKINQTSKEKRQNLGERIASHLAFAGERTPRSQTQCGQHHC